MRSLTKIGFTGTQDGMSVNQRIAVMALLVSDHMIGSEFHHGDCVGSDDTAGQLAWSVGFTVVLHPPTDERKRAFSVAHITHAPKPYIMRNHDIVDMTDWLLATPKGPEKQRSGTWATIRYAKKRGKRVRIIWPDGRAEEV